MTSAMKIRLSNVGALPDVEVPFDGLTVITGINGTGKSTVLKTIYCMFRPSLGFMDMKKESAVKVLRKIAEDKLEFNAVRGKESLEELLDLVEGIPAKKLDDNDRTLIRLVKDSLDGGNDRELYAETVGNEIVCEFGERDQIRNQRNGKKARIEIECSEGTCSCTVYGDDVDWTGEAAKMPIVNYYDTPFVMDPLESEAFSGHRMAMYRMLHDPSEFNMYDARAIRETRARFDRLVWDIIDGDILSDCSAYITRDGIKLDIRNMAAGVKVFAVLKVLLDKGRLKAGSFLLMDEPEAHLHPEYINVLAEVISTMVKDIGVRIIMTTHSPQLLMAISCASVKENIQTRFLHLSKHEDRITYSEVTDELNAVFGEMADAFTAADGRFEDTLLNN